MKAIVVYCADVGSIARKRFAWCRKRGSSWKHGGAIDELATAVAKDLDLGRPVALGFECPLFVPIPRNAIDLGRAREQEGSRSWSAGAGAGALSTGLVQAVWVLGRVHKLVARKHRAFLSWREFIRAGRGLLLWEAFVSGSAKRKSHLDDAKAGARAFHAGTLQGDPVGHISCSEGTYSLIGAAMLRERWSRDVAVLDQACLVFKGTTKRSNKPLQRTALARRR